MLRCRRDRTVRRSDLPNVPHESETSVEKRTEPTKTEVN